MSEFIHISGVTLILNRNPFNGSYLSLRFRKLSFSYCTGYKFSVLIVGMVLLSLKAKAKFSVSGLNCLLSEIFWVSQGGLGGIWKINKL